MAGRTFAVIAFGAWVALSASVIRGAEPTADELAQALQRKYDAVADFSADFVHTYQGGVLKRKLTERGKVLIKKPGKMRWDYDAPERKQFISDGARMYFYIPADRQVMVSPVPPDAAATTPALFLAGKGRLVAEFAASYTDLPADLPTGNLALKLVPKSKQTEYDWLVLVVDPASLAIRGLVTIDAQGGSSTFAFTNLKENVGLADDQFNFRIPRGVEVVG
ncbi:MAG TPA: outer membrane lipoprotein chaperone LolA [Vicinamibacterales bacterium]|nr:outer membrane lipoprotein chaperone LolA [Vicinamibacterales bacterium]